VPELLPQEQEQLPPLDVELFPLLPEQRVKEAPVTTPAEEQPVEEEPTKPQPLPEGLNR
jgi:hypothetical protein